MSTYQSFLYICQESYLRNKIEPETDMLQPMEEQFENTSALNRNP